MAGDLAARLERLEHVEAIKQLKSFYCHCIDDGRIDQLLERFTEDAVWDGGPFGRYEGQRRIRRFLENLPEHMTFYLHLVVNPLIEVEGETATGRWYLVEPSTQKADGSAVWGAGRYDEEYVLEDGVWKFKTVVLKPLFWTPYQDGWGKTWSIAEGR